MGAVMTQVNPLAGRTAELNEYEMSDLSVEEQLAGGASVDDLIQAGVLYDDYDTNVHYSFVRERTLEEIEAEEEKIRQQSVPLTKEEQLERIKEYFGEDLMTPDELREARERRKH